MADESNPHATLISTESCSMPVESLRAALETLDVTDEHAKVKAEIEASKAHWSELASTYYTCEEGPSIDSSSTLLPNWVHDEGTPEWKLEVAQDNKRMFQSLQEKYLGGFFIDENDLGPNSTQQLPKWMFEDDGVSRKMEIELSSATPFAEGGQAELFHAHRIRLHDGEKDEYFVMKVFKEEMPLRNLLKFFPITMLANDETWIQGTFGVKFFHANPLGGARLLKSSGRFAFLMVRAWGDLCKLIVERMLHSNNRGPPFPNDVAFYIIHQIARGMMELHKSGIIHRDLKAANVLVFPEYDYKTGPFKIDPMHLQLYHFHCKVADFECSVGIVGTRFWRAPEILEAVKNKDISQKPELFTKQVDVYSFGMTCYEILSGKMPFQELRTNDYDGVIGGKRPMLPIQTPPWMVDLVNRCWHQDPSMRPPFEEIVEILLPYVPDKKESEEEDS